MFVVNPGDGKHGQTSALHRADTGCSYLGVWEGPSLKFRFVHHHMSPALPVALEPRAAEALAGLPAASALWGEGWWWGQQKGRCRHLQGLSYFHPLPAPTLPFWPNPYSESGSTKLLLLCSLTQVLPPTGACAQRWAPGRLVCPHNPGGLSGSWRNTCQWERK